MDRRVQKPISIIVFLFLAFAALATPTIPLRTSSKPVTVSVAIPCAGQHFKYIPDLLRFYEEQTVIPDEIVISLSSVEKLSSEEIDAVEQREWPFRLHILRFEGKQSAGLNRTIATQSAGSDFIVCQDADDVPHPQRIEIAKYLFQTYEIDHLLHRFIEDGTPFATYEKTEVPLHRFNEYDQIGNHPLFGDRVHNGNICLLRKIAQKYKWDDVKTLDFDHDVKFNIDIYACTRNTLVIPCDLVIWRWKNSAFNPNNDPWRLKKREQY